MRPNLTFAEKNNRQVVIFWNNVDISDYDKVRQFNMSASEVDFFMHWELKEVQKQIKKILEVKTNENIWK